MRHAPTVEKTPLIKARVLPPEIEADLDAIVEELVQGSFLLIANKLEELGYPASGDMMPGEVEFIESTFEAFFRAMAMNSTIAAINDDD